MSSFDLYIGQRGSLAPPSADCSIVDCEPSESFYGTAQIVPLLIVSLLNHSMALHRLYIVDCEPSESFYRTAQIVTLLIVSLLNHSMALHRLFQC